MKISEIDLIIKTVNKYGTGLTNGDIELLPSAFHPKAMMYGCSGDNVTIVEIEGLFAYVASQKPPVVSGEQHRSIIKNIDVSGNCARAEVLQENCYGVNYINYFQLLKIEGQWLIVSKAYETVNNMIKYANASQFFVQISIRNHRFVVNLADNGNGCDGSIKGGGKGFKNIEKRALEMHGNLSIKSSSGNGTHLNLMIRYPFKNTKFMV